MPLVLGKARKILVTSADYARSSFYGRSIFRQRAEDVVEIPNGIDVDAFRPGIDASAIVDRYGLHIGDVVLLFVSSLDPSHARKGLDLLLETVSRLHAGQVKLIVVGDGAMRPAYVRRARQLGLDDQVVFAGRVPQEELPAYYAASDMVVIPSRPPEAFGVALAQGMAAGKPVIGSDIPGVRTVVENGESGFLIEPGDKVALAERIEQLAGDPDLRRQMGFRGRERIVRRYTWRTVGERLLALYMEVLGSRA
jgi:glycosyltransferase involved in cell wall biosynthesis